MVGDSPGGPCGPTGPACPRSERRVLSAMSSSAIDRRRISLDRTAPDRITAAPTALSRNCFAPTLLRGNCDTAYDVPPRATKSAKVATTLAYERCDQTRFMYRTIR